MATLKKTKEFYCRLEDDLKRLLRTPQNKIIIGNVNVDGIEPSLTNGEAEEYIWDEDRIIDSELSNKYIVPFTKCTLAPNKGFYPPPIKQISQCRAAYNIYVSLFPANDPNELPAAVEYWRKRANELMEKLLAGTIDLTEFEQVAVIDESGSTPGLPAFTEIEPIFTDKGIAGIGGGIINIENVEVTH